MAEYDAQPGRPTPPDPELSPAQRESDDVDLHAGLIGVARIVAGAHGVVDLLSDVAEFAVHAIPGVDGAGVTAIEMHGSAPRIQAWSVTADFVHDDRHRPVRRAQGGAVHHVHGVAAAHGQRITRK